MSPSARRRVLAAVLAPAAALAMAVPAVAADPAGPPTEVVQYQDWVTLRAGTVEAVPPAQCPAQYPYLVDRQYTAALSATTVPLGVELDRPGHVGVSIMRAMTVDGRFNGTAAADSSATNWDPFSPARFRLVLHCTSDPAGGYRSMNDLIAGWFPLATTASSMRELPAYDPARATPAFDR